MENFDKKIRESLDQHELPLDAGAWASMEQALDKAMPVGGVAGTVSTGTSWGWYAAGGAFIIASGVALFSLLSVNENNIGDSLASNQYQEIPVASEEIANDNSETSIVLEQAGSEDPKSSNQEPNAVESAIQGEVLNEDAATIEKSEQTVLIENSEVETKKVVPENEGNSATPSQKGFLLGFSPSAREICAGETVTFLNNTSEEKIEFVWNFGDGNSSTEHDPNHVFNTSGSYSVTLDGNRKGTNVSESQTINILVKSSPNAEVLSTTNLKVENLISYDALLTNEQTAEWKFSDGSFTTGSQANHLYLNPGVQKVKLTVKNSNGCIDRTELNESISEELEFFVGNTFTPNGDGSNDEFFIPVLRDLDVPFQLIVVDKNNQTVFKTTDANETWNGKHLNTGAPMPDGKYSYMLTLNKTYLKNNSINGKFNLQRR
ncbi:MAG: gliding motility-associated-like protein [Bacteroidia bacterium]|jgi:gliding motility-associated-like protein